MHSNAHASQVARKPAPIGVAARLTLEQHATELLQHTAECTFPLSPNVMSLDASQYVCADRFTQEKRRIFQRVPLVLAASCEIPDAGNYKTLEAAGIPVLLGRDRAGTTHALLNACTHRGAAVASGCGSTARFTCPYHGCTFAQDGALLGIASSADLA